MTKKKKIADTASPVNCILLDHDKQEFGIRDWAEHTRTTYLNPERIWPMMIEDPEGTREQLRCAGVLYHQIIGAVRFNQFHRAAYYLAAFHSYCDRTFGEGRNQSARLSLEKIIG